MPLPRRWQDDTFEYDDPAAKAAEAAKAAAYAARAHEKHTRGDRAERHERRDAEKSAKAASLHKPISREQQARDRAAEFAKRTGLDWK